jgi:alkylation response protein AidB-like acyl-CoA dehydrogenase
MVSPTIDADASLRRRLRMSAFKEPKELLQLREATRGFVASVSPETAVRALAAGGYSVDRAAWRRACVEQGWPALAVPEREGGAGFGLDAVAVVAEECGRALAFGPLLTTGVIGVELLRSGVQQDHLAAVLAGEALIGIVAELGGVDPGPAIAQATRTADGWLLYGRHDFVLGGADADLLLVLAATADGDAWFACRASATGVTREPLATLDLTRPQARVVLDAVEGELVRPPEQAEAAWARARQIARVMLAAEQVGSGGRLLELAVGYAGTRVQFGQPIGSFQAVKHKCADLLIALEQARSAVLLAVDSADSGGPDLPLVAAIASAAAGEALLTAAAETIQIHGGIGFTWEHPAHLYFRRAYADAELLGNPSQARAWIARNLGFGAA